MPPQPIPGRRTQTARMPTAWRRAGWSRGWVGEEGSVSAELAVATPLLMLMLLAIVQFALWSHATHIAQAAASQGLALLRAETGTPTGGCAHAREVLDQLAPPGHGPLTVTDLTCTRTATVASVHIRGTATPVIPLLTLPVHADAAGPVDRFTPDLPG